jgi:hypothetical protein
VADLCDVLFSCRSPVVTVATLEVGPLHRASGDDVVIGEPTRYMNTK